MQFGRVTLFPRETADQLRREVLSICQDYIRQILSCVREMTLMASNFSSIDELDKMDEHLLLVRKYKDQGREYRRILMQELAESGMLLMGRDDIIRLAIELGEIARYSESAAFMISYITERKLDVSDELRKCIFDLAKNSLKTVTGLRQAIMSLMYSRTGALEMRSNVEAAEFTVDELYRDIGLKILDSKIDLRVVLILRDIVDLIEEIADRAEDAMDLTTILALSL
jgi:uncharacterized protein Yka (UPF0111/DUF47 family)